MVAVSNQVLDERWRGQSFFRIAVQIHPAEPVGKDERQTSSLRESQEFLDDMISRVLSNRALAGAAMNPANSSIEKSQVIVDLRNSTDCRAGISSRISLPDGDGRADPLNLSDPGLLEPLEKLPCIGRKGLHVTPLALRIEDVEGQAGFSGTTHPGDDRELVVGNRDVDVLEVVLFGSPNNDGALSCSFFRHKPKEPV